MDLDPRLKVTKNQTGKGYAIPQLKIESAKLSDIGHLIRQGYEIVVRTAEGLDYTKELLTKIALMGLVSPHISNEIIYALSELIEEDLLYLIIENGGIEDYLTRKARGAINERH